MRHFYVMSLLSLAMAWNTIAQTVSVPKDNFVVISATCNFYYLNLTTYEAQRFTSSPYVSVINSVGSDKNNGWIFYTSDEASRNNWNIYGYNVYTDVHKDFGSIKNFFPNIHLPRGLSSGGATFSNGMLYLGIESKNRIGAAYCKPSSGEEFDASRGKDRDKKHLYLIKVVFDNLKDTSGMSTVIANASSANRDFDASRFSYKGSFGDIAIQGDGNMYAATKYCMQYYQTDQTYFSWANYEKVDGGIALDKDNVLHLVQNKKRKKRDHNRGKGQKKSYIMSYTPPRTLESDTPIQFGEKHEITGLLRGDKGNITDAADFISKAPTGPGEFVSISGMIIKENDKLTANGMLDPGEQGVQNFDVMLYLDINQNGALDPVDPLSQTVSTNIIGVYTFDNIPAGPGYFVRITNSNGSVSFVYDPDSGQTTPDGYGFVNTQVPSNISNYNFGIVEGIRRNFDNTVQLTVYPNPATSQFSVKAEESNIQSLMVIDQHGQTMLSLQDYKNNRIDIQTWRPGIYHVIMNFEDGTKRTKTLLKE